MSKDAEKKYRALFEQSPYGILLIDTEGKILDFNETAHRDLGYTREEFANIAIADIDPVESPSDVKGRISRILEKGSAEFETRHRTKQGEIRDVHVITKVLNLSGCTLLHSIWRDITERKRAENAVELFRNLLNRSSEAIFVNDPRTGRFLDMNDRACASLGYDREELLRMGVMDIEMNFPDNFSWQEHMGEVRQKGSLLLEGIHRRKDGTTFPNEANVSYVSLNSREYMIAVVRDITERKRAEEMLRETKTRLETLIQAMPDLIILKDTMGRYMMVNKAVEESTGCKQEEVAGKTNNELLPEDIAEMCNRSDAEAIRKGGPIHAEERSFDKEGRVQYLDTIKAPIYDGHGNRTGLICVARDVTERKQAEEALQRSEDKFRTLFESATDAIFILDMEGNFIDVNRTAYGRLGYTKEEMLSMHISQLDHPDFREKIPERMEHLQRHGWCICESAHLRKDGTAMPVEVNAEIIDFDGKKVFFSIIRDITERKRAEAHIETSLREKEVLLKEIHHRVKNNLNVIASLLSLQSRYITEPAVVGIFEECRNRINSMALIHEKLYQTTNFSKIDFKEYLNSLISMLSSSHIHVRDKVSVLTDIEDLSLDIDTAMTCGLITNELVTNCLKHAFPENRGGVINIRLFSEDGKRILSVRDNGIGLPDRFDLKSTNTLGLQLVRMLTKQLEGTMLVDVNNGTEIRISF